MLFLTHQIFIFCMLIYSKYKMENSVNICPISMEPIKEAKALNCMHVFEKECIDKWLEQNNTCPVCRFSVTSGTTFRNCIRNNIQESHQESHRESHSGIASRSEEREELPRIFSRERRGIRETEGLPWRIEERERIIEGNQNIDEINRFLRNTNQKCLDLFNRQTINLLQSRDYDITSFFQLYNGLSRGISNNGCYILCTEFPEENVDTIVKSLKYVYRSMLSCRADTHSQKLFKFRILNSIEKYIKNMARFEF